MSDNVRPDVAAFVELETLVRHLGDELAAFRRRALVAEARLRDLESTGDGEDRARRVDLRQRCSELERENAALTARVDIASERTRQMLERVRFIRQQTETSAGAER